jgi:hypothetical protein
MNFHVTFGYGLLFSLPYPTLAIDTFPHTGLQLGFSIIDFNHQEIGEQGGLLNQEKGILPGITTGITQKINHWGNLSAKFSFHSNKVEYNGQTSSGSPINTSTAEKIFDVTLQLERQFQIATKLSTYLYTGLGYHEWERDIYSTTTATGLLETYQWKYGLVGIKQQLLITNQSNWLFDYQLTYPIDSKIEIDAHGLFDKKQLHLTGEIGERFSLTWQYRLYHAMTISIEPYFEYWQLNRSTTEIITRNGIKVGQIFEPQGETANYGLITYLTYSF